MTLRRTQGCWWWFSRSWKHSGHAPRLWKPMSRLRRWDRHSSLFRRLREIRRILKNSCLFCYFGNIDEHYVVIVSRQTAGGKVLSHVILSVIRRHCLVNDHYLVQCRVILWTHNTTHFCRLLLACLHIVYRGTRLVMVAGVCHCLLSLSVTLTYATQHAAGQ